MIVVTGGAGFIGSNLVKALNQRGEKDILVVDNLARADKFRNIADCDISDYLDRHDFIEGLRLGDYEGDISAIVHEGACSDTMESDGIYMMNNNYEYSKTLLDFCVSQKAQFIYASSASVYGAGKVFVENPEYEDPLNIYAYSKTLFDRYVRRHYADAESQIVGLRYFNVYGDREQHKGRMASVAFHFFHQYRDSGKVKLFEGSDGYANGDQRRDFVSVEDVTRVNLHFLDHPERSGIFNVGTGRSQPFNDMASATVNSLRELDGEPALELQEMVDKGIIEYIPFPDKLKGKYQSFTQADITRLREQGGYTDRFYTVEEGVSRYIRRLAEKAAGK